MWEGVVAVFSGFPPALQPEQISASVSWGDYSSNSWSPYALPGQDWVRVESEGGVMRVYGRHQYTGVGFYTATVNVSVASVSATSSGSVVVVGAPIHLNVSPIQPVEGRVFTGTVASFTTPDLSPNAASKFSAVIDWGNGQLSSGSVSPVLNTPGAYTVSGSMGFADEFLSAGGSSPSAGRQITVRVWSGSGGHAEGSAAVTVVDAPLAVNLSSGYSATTGKVFRGWFGGFDDGAFDQKSEFTATIDWGDGQSSTGIIKRSDEPLPPNYDPNLYDQYGYGYHWQWGWNGYWDVPVHSPSLAPLSRLW